MRSVGFVQLGAFVLAFCGAGAADFEIARSTMDCGGGMRSTGGPFQLSGTIGQPDVGLLRRGKLEVTGGFWFARRLGDCNVDNGVDLTDYAAVEQCCEGPGGSMEDPLCWCGDFDGDDDVDLSDMAAFQNAYSGP